MLLHCDDEGGQLRPLAEANHAVKGPLLPHHTRHVLKAEVNAWAALKPISVLRAGGGRGGFRVLGVGGRVWAGSGAALSIIQLQPQSHNRADNRGSPGQGRQAGGRVLGAGFWGQGSRGRVLGAAGF